jgi:hypothetical protein
MTVNVYSKVCKAPEFQIPGKACRRVRRAVPTAELPDYQDTNGESASNRSNDTWL